MAWFAVYEVATGRLISTGTSVADDASLTARGLAKRTYVDSPQVKTKQWNEATQDFDDVSLPKPRISTRTFIVTIPHTEREAMFEAVSNGTPMVRKLVNTFIETAKMVGHVDLGDAQTIGDLDAMVTAGILSAATIVALNAAG